MPTGSVTLIIGLGEPLWSASDGHRPRTLTSFVAGIQDRPTVVGHHGGVEGLQIELTAVGAYALFGVSGSELAGEVVALHELLGRDGDLLVDRVASATTRSARLNAACEGLAGLAAKHPRPSPEVAWLSGQLSSVRCAERVGGVASAIGWSRRHLNEQFRLHVGVPPKRFARLHRFRRAVRMLAPAPAPSLVGVAQACGYFDQAS
jgi:AraC-like DNA-binding protein